MNKRKKLGKVISNVSRIMLVTILTLLTLTILNPRADAAGSCSHQNCTDKVVTPASCTTAGLRVTYCKDCGTRIEQKPIPALGHSYGAWKTTKKATCTAAGTRERSCTRCNNKQTESITKLGHSYGAWKTTKEATCTAAGTRERSCTRCSNKQTESIAKLGHDLTRNVVDPTCTAAGYAETTCSRCSYYRKDETEALGHSYGAWKTTKKATCTAAGTRERSCTRCNNKQTESITKLGHSYGAWKATKEATCTAAGTRERSCARCSNKQTESIAKLGHDLTRNVVDPTCTAAGYAETTCSRCSYYRKDETEALGHIYGAWKKTTEPTCTADGKQERRCTRCNTKQTQTIIRLGHDLTRTVVDPTCTAAGYAETTCSRCSYYRKDETEALGHKYGIWTRTKEPTCTADGEQERSCTRCNAIQTKKIAKLGHDLTRNVVDPTCTAAGYAETTCSRCSYYRKDEIEALGHDYDCRGICSRCGYQSSSNYQTKQEALEALCMELSESSISNPATAEMVISGEYLSNVSSFDFSSSFMPFGPNHFEFKPSEGYLEDSLLDGRGSFIYQYIIHPVESYPSNSGQIVLLDPRTNKLYHTSQYAWDVMVVEISADFPSEDKDEVSVQFTMMHQFRIVYTPTAMTARGTTTGFVSVEKTLYSLYSISPGMQIGFDKNSDYYIAMLRKAETIKGKEFTRVAADIANVGFACLHAYQKDWVGFSQDVFNIVNETFNDKKNWEGEAIKEKSEEIKFRGKPEAQGYEAGVQRIVVETKPEQQLRRAGDSVNWLVKIGCKNNPSGPDLPHQLRIIIYFRTNFPGV